MSIAERREELAQVITDSLQDQWNDKDIKVRAYKPNNPAGFTGWLEINQTDTEGCTYGEVRLTVECLVLIATDRTQFEKVHDVLAAPLMASINAAGGRGVTLQPAEYPVGSATLYCLSATFVTETLIESEVV